MIAPAVFFTFDKVLAVWDSRMLKFLSEVIFQNYSKIASRNNITFIKNLALNKY